MHRNPLFPILAAAVLLAATPAALAQPTVPFGILDGQLQGGNASTGVMTLLGWALDDDGVESVDFYVDGFPVGRAFYGHFRPAVASIYSGFPDAAGAGFSFRLDTTRFLNGLHTVSALVTSETGEKSFLNPLVFEFFNTTHLLVPFGNIEFPPEDQELYGNCDVTESQRRLAVVTGHALDVGVETGDFGVGYVELLLDGAILYNSKVDCRYVPGLGGFTQCYGLRRMDVERAFPLIKDSPHAGFRFVLDVGDLINFGFSEGRHILGIRVGDVAGQVAVIDEIPITFRCDDLLGNEQSFGDIDLPFGGLLFGGTPVQITGYAIDFEGIDRVEIYVDGSLAGIADLSALRPSVVSSFPGYPVDGTADWSFNLDVTALADGFHQVQAIVVDDLGESHLVGERTFQVRNP